MAPLLAPKRSQKVWGWCSELRESQALGSTWDGLEVSKDLCPTHRTSENFFFGDEKLILLGALFSVYAQLFDFHLELKAATRKLTPPDCQGGRGINLIC